MATFDAGYLSQLGYSSSTYGNYRVGGWVPLGGIPSTIVRHYKMLGYDHTLNTSDTWEVTGVPDLTGAHYSGSLTTPLRNIAICLVWDTAP